MSADPTIGNGPAATAGTGKKIPAQEANWQDFRDHLSTADKDGRRQWLYPKKPHGRFYRWRTWMSWLLLAVMFAGPFIKINGNPLLMINVVERKFSILGKMFWPQDGVVFAVAMLLFLTGIVVFTAAFGRLWCGWACPQTVLMEMVFRKLEYWIEGDSGPQRALAAAPWTPAKIAKKTFKQLLFFGLSFIIGNVLLSYIIGIDSLVQIITDDPRNHIEGLAFMLLFTLIFYAIFARFREQACTFICPYGRLQSTLIDENSIVVAYDHKRGEKRGHLRRGVTPEQRAAQGHGDCVDCHACVAVCPTGIDIRNGTQMECVHCTACMDACDAIMDRVHRPRGLIRYASLNGIEKGLPLRVTPRLLGYTALLLLLGAVLTLLVFTRSDVEATLLRAPGAMFQIMPDGRISNLYLLKVTNKTSAEMPVTLKLENLPGEARIMSGDFKVPARKLTESSVLVQLNPKDMAAARAPLIIGVYSGPKLLHRIKTVFIGPRDRDYGK